MTIQEKGEFKAISLERIEIIPDTLCEFTKRIDKNGNEIYENDIVRAEIDGELVEV